MVKGFTFGKFLPFHKGHEALINFALKRCDHLSVLVCESDLEMIPGELRKKWIDDTFSHIPNIDVKVFKFNESELSSSSVPSEALSKQWSNVFKEYFPNYQIVFTSELYGNYVAKYMNIIHIEFDNKRKIVPISATEIRTKIFDNWNYLPKSVQEHLMFKVIISGTESTGKSTLVKELARIFNCNYVSEAGRDIIKHTDNFSINDLYDVVDEHTRRIKETTNTPILIIDTDINTTRSYAELFFSLNLQISKETEKINQGNLYLYLDIDNTQFVQDGTRTNDENRKKLDILHKFNLHKRGHKFIKLFNKSGYEERLTDAIKIIETEIQKAFSQKIFRTY